ncbi:MAG: endopeptidase La [Anaerolineales bacterium]|nr:MAG: endopeptidase La [Anaerolineales bacterium]
MLPWLNLFSDQEDAIKIIPGELPILPLRNTVIFPSAVTPIVVGIPRSVKLVEEAVEGNRLIGLVAMQDPSIETPGPGQVYQVGTVGLIHKVIKGSDENLQVIIQGIERFQIKEWIQEKPYLKAQIELAPEQVEESVEIEALRRSLLDLTRRLVSLTPQLPDEIMEFITRVENPRYLIYLIAANLRIEVAEAQDILALDGVADKMRKLVSILAQEVEVLELGKKIQSEAQSEMEKAQRDYFLREQLKAIKKELGEADETTLEVQEYRQKIAESGMPEEAEKEALRELGRLEKMPPQAAEYSVIKTYLDWLTDLPWQTLTEDNLDIAHARQVLDEDHYDLTDIKDRMLEFLAVRKLRLERGIDEEEETAEEGPELSPVHRDAQATVLCFIGPPGTGKTSLGRSVAHALGRKFTRMSLGGVRDEAEIRGHRRTYIGALPGRIIQAVKRVGTRNPVFMLDEVDKIGADWRGDPSSALLEVLDPQQNCSFRDHYLDVDFDLSQVMFICTGNLLEPIPPPLRDRMEILTLDGYTEYEKIKIAQGYLIPRQIRTNGLRPDEIVLEEAALRAIIRDHTHESGVRNLEREIGRVCRKVATQVAAGEIEGSLTITTEKVREFLGKPKYFFEAALRTAQPGVATGLAVTPAGGEVLFIEAAQMPGKEQLILTGQLGDVMQESARIALSYVRAKTDELEIPPNFFEGKDIHLHVPAGATPKDGPSAGVAMATALVSLLTGRSVRADVGMTGEITLQGQVLPIGGTKQKVLAAHRAGLKTVVVPQRNEADLDDVPEDVREEMTFVLAETIDQVLEAGLEKASEVELAKAA